MNLDFISKSQMIFALAGDQVVYVKMQRDIILLSILLIADRNFHIQISLHNKVAQPSSSDRHLNAYIWGARPLQLSLNGNPDLNVM